MTAEQAYRDHFQHMVNYANTILKDMGKSEDVAMSIIEDLITKKLDVGQGFLFKGVKFRSLDQLRRDRVRVRKLSNFKLTEISIIEHDPLFLLGKQIDIFTPLEKKVFMTTCINGFTPKDASKKIGIKLSTLKPCKSRLLKKIKQFV